MYAIIKDRGQQYKVGKGETLLIDRTDTENGAEITFEEVTFYSDKDKTLVGAPILENVRVTGEVISEEKGEKVIVFKMKRRKRYRRRQGHREKYTKIMIKDITVS